MNPSNSSNADNPLGIAPVGSLLAKFAIPAIISMLVNALYNMVDRMYIGHIPGEGAAALTGLGVCFPIIMIVSAFAALMGMGGAPRASILMGKKDNEGAEKIYQQLSKKYNCEYDDRGNIGKRYRRQDEIGTPYCVTYDFESETDGAVTVRDRDTMEQERVKIEDLKAYFEKKMEF